MRRSLFPRLLAACASLTLTLAAPAAAQAQGAAAEPRRDFPNRVVRIVVPFSPGGSADQSARILAERLAELWGQPVIVDNRPGAGTTIASAHVAQSPPDGHTLYLAYVLSYATSAGLYRRLPYDPRTALAPVSLVADAPFILTASPGTNATSVGELIAASKAAPQGLLFASTGNGAGPHLATAMFLQRAGVTATHVPYKGTADAVTALLGDQAHFSMFDVSALPQLRSGRLKPLAVSTSRRWSQLPNVPTVAESGFPGFEVSSGAGIMVAGGTPAAIVERLNEAVRATMATPSVRERFEAQGFVPQSSTPQAFGELLAREMERIGRLINEIGLKID